MRDTITNFDFSLQAQLNLEICLLEYCFSGDISAVERLIQSPDTAPYFRASQQLNKALELACENNHFEIVQYLINHTKVMSSPYDKTNFLPFLKSCEKGHMRLVRFFLTSLYADKPYAYIHKNNDKALLAATQAGQVEVMRYLLTSPEITQHACVNSNIFLAACISMDPELKSLHYLLFDLKVDSTQLFVEEYFAQNDFLLKNKAAELIRIQRDKLRVETHFPEQLVSMEIKEHWVSYRFPKLFKI